MVPKQKNYNYCFNPFNLEKHGRKDSKNLRRVLPSMLRKLNVENVSLTVDMKICDYCRLRLSKILEISETSNSSSLTEDPQPGTSAVRSSNCDKDSTPTKKLDDIQILNESLPGLGESPINKRKLPQNIYSRDKLEKLQKTLDSNAFHVEGETEKEIEKSESTIIEKLKESFHSTSDRNKKIQILTIFEDWSFKKIQDNFGASKHMITVAKNLSKNFGILSTPNARSGKKLNQATENCIVDFYASDLMSRVIEGKKNYVTVKENGTKNQKQKRMILNNLKEMYCIFKEKYPDLKVGFSKFCALRPKHCILSRASGTHSVCVCGAK